MQLFPECLHDAIFESLFLFCSISFSLSSWLVVMNQRINALVPGSFYNPLAMRLFARGRSFQGGFRQLCGRSRPAARTVDRNNFLGIFHFLIRIANYGVLKHVLRDRALISSAVVQRNVHETFVSHSSRFHKAAMDYFSSKTFLTVSARTFMLSGFIIK